MTTFLHMQVDGEDPKASLARALDELGAAKARVERDAKAVHAETRKQLVGELLPVLDNVDRAIAAGDPTAAQGMQLVKRQLEAVLRGYGVERVDAAGAAFDPALHDAITTVPVTDPAQHRRVVDQIEPGYRFGDALLRPAKVVVGSLAAVPEPEPAPADAEPLFFPPIPSVRAHPVAPPPAFRQPAAPARDPFDVFRIPTRRRRAW